MYSSKERMYVVFCGVYVSEVVCESRYVRSVGRMTGRLPLANDVVSKLVPR